MSPQVVSLISRPARFTLARAAFAAGRNAECLSMLHRDRSMEAAFLCTRALIRLGRLEDAERVVRSTLSCSDGHRDLARCHMLLGTVLDRQGDYESAAEAFLNARAYVYSIPSVALHAEFALYEPLSAWRQCDFELVENIVSESLHEAVTVYDEPHIYPLEVSRAFMYELLALVQGVRERYEAQIDFLKQGFKALDQSAQQHVWAETGLLWNFATLVPELRLPNVADMLRERAESLEWPPETAARGYIVYRALAWNEALNGNYVSAFRDLRKSQDLAPTIAWRIESILDRAYLFHQTDQSLAAQEGFDAAIHLFTHVDWAGSEEERVVLLWAAEICAQLDVERASMLLEQYKSIRKPIDPALMASKGIRKCQACEHDAYGAVAAATGAPTIALTHLRTALQTWDDLKFEWRAAKTANAIASITNSTDDIAGARRRAEPFAKSWLARSAWQ
jgi:tetratricopeptide (TPR) repeat protein